MLGNWFSACEYGGLTYPIVALCEDARLRMVWFAELKTFDVFESVGSIVDTRKTLRNGNCSHFSVSKEPFFNFVCFKWSLIPLQSEF